MIKSSVIFILLDLHSVSRILSNPLNDSSKIQLGFYVDGAYICHTANRFPKRTVYAHVDHYLIKKAPYASKINNNSDSVPVTDNPLNHGTYYFRISGKTSFNRSYTLYTNIILEHRGFSYGPNDLDNIVVYPQAYFSLNDTFKIKDKNFTIEGKFGDLWDFKINNGLKMYNLDAQGVSMQITTGNYFYRYNLAGDLSYGIGINLNEIHQFSTGCLVKKNDKVWENGLSYAINSTAPVNLMVNPTERKSEFGIFSTFKQNEFSLYFESGLNTKPFLDMKSNMALLLGTKYNYLGDKLNFSLNTEIRYYGKMYNAAYFEANSSLYRDTLRSSSYSNTVGRYHYPINNYFNNFSQWAVYTEYQGMDIMGLEFRSVFEKSIIEKLFVSLKIESVNILKENSKLTENDRLFSYLFYEIGVKYNVLAKVDFSLFVHNKNMNLDKSYQTFYMSKEPYLGFSVIKTY